MTQKSFRAQWSEIDQASEPESFVQFMDRVRPNEDDPAQYGNLFEQLAAQPGEYVLDIGCGTGGAARALAHQVKGINRVIGVDNSRLMIEVAQKRAAGLNLPIEYQVMDAHHLRFDDDTFDGCYSLGVFEIIKVPRQVLAEMIRVLRPGGRLVINTTDTDARMIDATDREVTRKIIHYVSDYEMNGWIGRQLPGYCHEMGLTDIKVETRSWVITNYERWAESAWRGYAERAHTHGVISATQLADWFRDLEARHQAGRFFATTTFFSISAKKSR